MENNLLSKTFKIFHTSQDNTVDIMEDPINQINESLNNLLINLNNENPNKYGCLQSDLYLENKQINKDDDADEVEEVEEIFNLYKLKDNFINNMNNYNLTNNISRKENEDKLSNNNKLIPSSEIISLRQSKKNSNNAFDNEKNFKSIQTSDSIEKRKCKSNNKLNNRRMIFKNNKINKNNDIKNDNNNNNAIKNDKMKDYQQIFEKIEHIKDSNTKNKKEILNFKQEIIKVFQMIINNISKKENIINQQHQRQINQMINEINLYKYNMNEILASEKTKMNLDIHKLKNIINQNNNEKRKWKLNMLKRKKILNK